MNGRIERVRNGLAEVMAGFDAHLVDARTAAGMVEAFGAIERMAAAGRALAAARVAETRVWAESGHRSAAHWLASAAGTSVGEAVSTLETARNLDGLDATAAALRTGELSLSQAAEVTSAAALDPRSEPALLAAAADKGLAGLRDEAHRVKAGVHADANARDEHIRRTRHARQWVDSDGAWRMSARATVVAGARIWAAIEAEQTRLVEEARAQDRMEPAEALAFDALEMLARRPESAEQTRPSATMHLRVDHTALTRGHTEGGEVCQIPGLGPVPVATARALMSDAILSIVVTKGVEVVGVAHAGRTIRANVRRALMERSPTCEIADCRVDHDLEIDHVTGYVVTKDTRLDDLARLCGWHHYLKTHQGYRLSGPPGSRQLGAPGRAPPGAA